MELLGVFAFIMVLMYMSYPNRIRRLEREVKRLKNRMSEGLEMSKMIQELVGKTCKITVSDGLQSNSRVAVVLEADEDWVKFETAKKKGEKSIVMMRIDEVQKIEILER